MTTARLVRVPLAVACSPQAALAALSDDPWPFALTGRWAGGGAIVGSAPVRVARPDEDPFALLDELPTLAPAPSAAAPDAVGGGWFGWLGYQLAGRLEALPPGPPRPHPLPPFQLAYYDHVLRRDAAGRWWFEALATPARERALAARQELLRTRLAAAADATPLPATAPREPFRIVAGGGAAHEHAVAACRDRIAAGEIFQANICLRFETAWDGDVAQLFARASAAVEPAYGATFPAPWGGIASLSPELFLRRRGRAVETGPIKGTVARAARADDLADPARAALATSDKNHAEHVMVVDLMRNDLGRVCAYGSVEAAAVPDLEPHPGVWHLVSRVRGTLAPAVTDADLLRATFPPGSVTGAPKVRALRVIAELEATGRELYTGAIGYASPLAGLELSVAIRTFEACDGRLALGSGGGIVADSDPRRELEECRVKARPLVAAIGGALADDAPPRRRPSPAPPAALADGRARPDPSAGLLETMLVRDGAAVAAADHLARLGASAATVYGLSLPADLPARVARVAADVHDGRVRVVAVPVAGRLEVAVEAAPHPPRPLPIPLAPFTLPGGLGAHKWRDRALLDALARAADGATPLLVEGDGTVLEAAWGNVFALDGDRLWTPPADGRILPGVTRARLLAAATAAGLAPCERPLPLAKLAAADALLVTSAAALAVPARLADAPADAARDERASALAARLRALLDPAAATAAAARG